MPTMTRYGVLVSRCRARTRTAMDEPGRGGGTEDARTDRAAVRWYQSIPLLTVARPMWFEKLTVLYRAPRVRFVVAVDLLTRRSETAERERGGGRCCCCPCPARRRRRRAEPKIEILRTRVDGRRRTAAGCRVDVSAMAPNPGPPPPPQISYDFERARRSSHINTIVINTRKADFRIIGFG